MRNAIAKRLTIREVIATNLQRQRRARGLSREELATAAGLLPGHLELIERAERGSLIDEVEQLADALGIEPVELLENRIGPR